MKPSILILLALTPLALPNLNSSEKPNPPSFQPAEVTLRKAVKIELVHDGKKTGELVLPKGRSVQVLKAGEKSLDIQVGDQKTDIRREDTDYSERVEQLKKDWEQKTVLEKRAKLIAETTAPKPSTPPQPAPPETIETEKTKTEPEELKTETTGTKDSKALRFLLAQPFQCIENGQLVAVCSFLSDGTFVLKTGQEGKWKMDRDELVTTFRWEGKDRVNRYNFDSKHMKWVGQRDRRSDIQDKASLYMMPLKQDS
ncbi:MAG: hypothetical protein HC904_12240 [Blastochloris sp.]|nr:hypothetical protein [Blastochloris sp.]